MRLCVLAVGRLKERHWVEACDEYAKRIRRHLGFEVVEVKRGEDLIARCPPRLERWLLDERGRQLSSPELAQELARRMNAGSAGMAFLIGGAEGLPEGARAAADFTLSLGRMTLAHRLARLVLCEQLYRALSIIKGEPYHK
jgi:23S rRNA (pseudouridine1915-N3)-methyltransferase